VKIVVRWFPSPPLQFLILSAACFERRAIV
jgi:hypothetical protein